MSLNSNLYVIGSGEELEIAVGDWVDLVPNLLAPNEANGLSYQVVSLYNREIGILAKADGQVYSEILVSACYVLNNYRKVSNEK